MSGLREEPSPDPRSVKLTPEAAAIIEAQTQAFREKFGREPGPNDPIFFNPDADEPEFFTEQQAADVQAIWEEHFGEERRVEAEAELERRGMIKRPGDPGYEGPPPPPRKRGKRKRPKRR